MGIVETKGEVDSRKNAAGNEGTMSSEAEDNFCVYP